MRPKGRTSFNMQAGHRGGRPSCLHVPMEQNPASHTFRASRRAPKRSPSNARERSYTVRSEKWTAPIAGSTSTDGRSESISGTGDIVQCVVSVAIEREQVVRKPPVGSRRLKDRVFMHYRFRALGNRGPTAGSDSGEDRSTDRARVGLAHRPSRAVRTHASLP